MAHLPIGTHLIAESSRSFLTTRCSLSYRIFKTETGVYDELQFEIFDQSRSRLLHNVIIKYDHICDYVDIALIPVVSENEDGSVTIANPQGTIGFIVRMHPDEHDMFVIYTCTLVNNRCYTAGNETQERITCIAPNMMSMLAEFKQTLQNARLFDNRVNPYV